MSIADKISRLNTAKNNIASAISSKGGTVGTGDGYEEFADDILTIPTAGNYQSKDVTYTSNGERTVTPDSGYDALSEVNVLVNVSAPEPVLQQKTVTPSASQQIVRPDSGYDGLSQVTVNTDSNLVGANIKNGVSVFGVNGNFTADADAVATDIISGKTAYVAGNKITGSIQSKAAQTFTPGTTDQVISAGQYLSGAQTILGSQFLISANIKKDITIFGVTGSYEPQAVPIAGSLIVCTFSGLTNIVVRYGSAEETMVIVGDKGYAVVPYTFTGTVYVDGYVGSVLFATRTISITEINLYQVSIFTSFVIYNSGVWDTSLASHSWAIDTSQSPVASVTELADHIHIVGGRQYVSQYQQYVFGVRLNNTIPTNGFSKIKITFSSIVTESNSYIGYKDVNDPGTTYPSREPCIEWYDSTVRKYNMTAFKAVGSTTSNTVDINQAHNNVYLCFVPWNSFDITRIELI